MQIPNCLFDSHCHTSYITHLSLTDIVDRCKLKNVSCIWSMSVVEEDFIKVIADSETTNGFVRPFLGVDPEVFVPNSTEFVGFEDSKFKINKWKQKIIDSIYKYNSNPMIQIGIGEIGLDMYWLRKNKCGQSEINQSIDAQISLFRSMLEIASEFSLPVSIHSRGYEYETFNIVKEFKINSTVVFHSFTGGFDLFLKIISAGYFIGINAISTYKTGSNVLNNLTKVLNKKLESLYDLYNRQILLETDAPYLSIDRNSRFSSPDQVYDLFEFLKSNL